VMMAVSGIMPAAVGTVRACDTWMARRVGSRSQV